MAKICAICGKSTMATAHRRHNTTSNISRHGAWGHRGPKTVSTQKPNLKKVTLTDGDTVKKEMICMKCYKKVLEK